MAEYGLFCAKLREGGLGVVADVIEALMLERDDLRRERDNLLRERAAIIDIARAGECGCETCLHVYNQDEACELPDHACDECSRAACYCRDCVYGDKWEFKGERE